MSVLMDELQSTLQFRSTIDAVESSRSTSLETLDGDPHRSLSYNSFFKHLCPDGSSPAKWRMRICHQINELLQHNVVSIDYIMAELQKYLITERYGFNGDIINILATNGAPINSTITFRGSKCTLFHGVAALCGSCPLTQCSLCLEYIVQNRPILDLHDEHGRTALVVAVFGTTTSSLNSNEVHFMRCCIEYGFSIEAKWRGISVMDKLSKMVKSLKPPRGSRPSCHQPKAAQYLIHLVENIAFYRLRIEAVHSALKRLIDRNTIVQDVADCVLDYVGISHFDQTATIQPISRQNSGGISRCRRQLVVA